MDNPESVLSMADTQDSINSARENFYGWVRAQHSCRLTKQEKRLGLKTGKNESNKTCDDFKEHQRSVIFSGVSVRQSRL